jgi:hypothetical protein
MNPFDTRALVNALRPSADRQHAIRERLFWTQLQQQVEDRRADPLCRKDKPNSRGRKSRYDQM